MVKIIRTEAHALATTPELRLDVERTIAAYRRAVRALSGVILVHWPELANAKSKCQAVESLFHPTAKRPVVRYAVLDRIIGKMPSYLRRAAIEHAFGSVYSFLSNYSNWLDGEIGGKPREIGLRAPRLGFNKVFPSLYGGNMIVVGQRTPPIKTRFKDRDGFVGPLPLSKQRKVLTPKQLAANEAKAGELATPYGFIRVKLLGADGQWSFSAPLRMHGKPKRLGDLGAMDLSPTLMQRGSKVWVSCPVEVQAPHFITNIAFAGAAPQSSRVCSVDVGINTAATAAIVDSTGTVIARKFLTCGRHNDRRDALGVVIADKQRQSGGIAKGERHAVALHRRIAGLSLDAARVLASEVAAFAALHGAKILVIEDLKGWRPKGPSKVMRKRFHRFQHRAVVQCLTHKAQELGVRLLEVYARGTSRWAYDGSGKVTRSKENAQLACFTSGKRYNADLNGALNIAASGLAMVLGVKSKEIQADTGQSSGSVARVPLVLADIWDWVRAKAPSAQSQVPGGSSNHQALA